MVFLDEMRALLGAAHVLTGPDAAPYGEDFTKAYTGAPEAVLRPATTLEVAGILRAAHAANVPIIPISGGTGLNGGAHAPGGVMLSLARLNQIEEIRPEARVAVVGAGVVLETLHAALAEHDLTFPVTFGAKGSAMIGGILSTNAGGSNVLRYGNTRDLVLGIEVVLADGRVMDLMSALHKDNTGYDLRHLMIGAEGTLGVITRAALKLAPLPQSFATAMIAARSLDDALVILNRVQAASGGLVEAFEYMPQSHFSRLAELRPGTRMPFETPHDINILVELGGDDGCGDALEELLGEMLDSGAVIDAVIAQNETQRREMWGARDAAAEIAFSQSPVLINDIALPLDGLSTFYREMEGVLARLDPTAETGSVAHLGDGNIHFVVYPSDSDPAHKNALMVATEDLVRALGGSFSAEHGIGLSKKPSMARQKDAVALDVMRAIKAALDPKGILNPGKVLPD